MEGTAHIGIMSSSGYGNQESLGDMLGGRQSQTKALTLPIRLWWHSTYSPGWAKPPQERSQDSPEITVGVTSAFKGIRMMLVWG